MSAGYLYLGCEMSVTPARPTITDGRPHPQSPTPTGQTRAVLLAEDDDAVRTFVLMALEHAGFTVAAAADGVAAEKLFAAEPERFDLVLTDVIMPHMSGPELAARIRHVRHDIPVLFMSAFTGGAGWMSDPLPPNESLLDKPFTVAALLEAVHRSLGDPSA